MPTTYSVPDDADTAIALFVRVFKDAHSSLVDAGVRVGLTFASNDRGPAVRSGGHACLATVRVVPLRDRVRKDCDAEITIDEGRWKDLSDAQRAALLDHEATRLSLIHCAKTGSVKRDDLGRPRLKLVRGDLVSTDGFSKLVSRHGEDSVEFESVQRAHLIVAAAMSEAD